MQEDTLQHYTSTVNLQSVEMCPQFYRVQWVINKLVAVGITRTESGHVSNASTLNDDFNHN